MNSMFAVCSFTYLLASSFCALIHPVHLRKGYGLVLREKLSDKWCCLSCLGTVRLPVAHPPHRCSTH